MSDDSATSEMPKTVSFEHKVFSSFESAYFRKSEQTDEPVFMVKLGANEVALSFPGLLKEFRIDENSIDAKMLDLVAEALNYVIALRVGDPIPPELTTGAASWEPQPKHRILAHQRLTLQLVTWLTGEEHQYTSSEDVMQLVEDPRIKKEINHAFEGAAEKLGLGRENKQQVVQYIEQLANELAYVEAMRDVYQAICGMEAKMQEFRRLYGAERSVLEVIDPVARLCRRGMEQIGAQFMEVDAQTCEIMSMLRNIDSQVNYIRHIRDDVHRKLMPWEGELQRWAPVKVKALPEIPEMFRKTYHFLASRYMPVSEWVLVTKPKPPPPQMSQLDAAKDKLKVGAKSMSWG